MITAVPTALRIVITSQNAVSRSPVQVDVATAMAIVVWDQTVSFSIL